MKFKRLSAAILAGVMCFGVFSTTAFAYVDENAAKEEPVVEEKAPEKEPEEPMEPLTPDGNMTLVDDEGKHPDAGKQFITAVTKNGNYFYIIIDRDDKGKETVHFLNQVDEADLLKLMDEKEAEKYTKPEKEPTPEPEKEPVPEVQEPEEPEKPKVNMVPAVIALGVYEAEINGRNCPDAKAGLSWRFWFEGRKRKYICMVCRRWDSSCKRCFCH